MGEEGEDPDPDDVAGDLATFLYFLNLLGCT